FFFFQAEDGIRDFHVTGVQTCALPIWLLDALDVRVGDLLVDGLADRVDEVERPHGSVDEGRAARLHGAARDEHGGDVQAQRREHDRKSGVEGKEGDSERRRKYYKERSV